MSTEFEPNVTTLRINGESFYKKGNEQRLLFKFEDLMVSVGGFLGLFIGLSLYDVVETFVEFFMKFEKKFQSI